ncbi:MAG: hypothetical protein AAFQ94_00845, partial [Bacteroidota bacterium]
MKPKSMLVLLLFVSSMTVAQTTVSRYSFNTSADFLSDAVGANTLINGNNVPMTDGISGQGAALFTGDSAFLETDPIDIFTNQSSLGVEMLVKIDESHDATTNGGGIMTLIGQWGVGSNRTFRVNVAWDDTQQASAIKFAIRLRNDAQFFDGSDDASIPEADRIYLQNDVVYYLGCFLENTSSNTTDSIRFIVKDLTNNGPVQTAAVVRGIGSFEEDTNVDEPIRIGRSGDEFFQFKGIIDNVRISSGGVNSGIISPLLTTTEWDGSSWSNDEPISGFDAIISSSYATAGNGSFTTNNLTLNATTSIGAGDYIEVDELLTNNSTMSVSSGGSLVTKGTLAGTGTYNFERVTTHDNATAKYSAVGSPITDGNVSVLGSPVWEFDESVSGDLERFTVPSGILTPGRGYFSAATGTVSFQGVPNTGDVQIAVTNDQDGFNLISNPYPGAISYQDFVNDNSSVISGTIYIWSEGSTVAGTRPSQGDYITITGAGSVSGTPNDSKSFNDHIGSMQGFFVKANTAGNVTFSDDQKVLDSNSDDTFFRQSNAGNNRIKLALTGQDEYDETLIAILDDASDDVDRLYDGHKFNVGSTQIYSTIEEAPFSIQAVPVLTEMPLFINIEVSGDYELTILENSLPESVKLYPVVPRIGLAEECVISVAIQYLL